MGKKNVNKKKGKGAEKTAMKTDKKQAARHKKLLETIGEKDIGEIVAQLETAESNFKTVTESTAPPPSARSSFSLCAHPEKDELVLYGGEFFNGQNLTVYNDLYFYNIPKNEWKLVKAPAGPGPRSAHQMVSVATDGGQLWLFGGEHASPSQMQFYHYRDLWVYRMVSKKWEKINAADGPSPRSGHRMVVNKKRLFVFGGFYDNNVSYKYYNDMYMFSMETYTWTEIKAGGSIIPPPRSACCMAATPDGKILVWGGYSRATIKKEVDRGVTHTDMYSLVPDKNDGKSWKWTTVKASGMRPPPRSSVNVAIAANGKAYTFGGVMDVEEDEENLQGKFSNEIHALDLSSQTWRLVEVTSKKEKTSKKTKDKAAGDVEMDDEDAGQQPTVSSDGVFTMVVNSAATKSEDASESCAVNKVATNGPSQRMKAGVAVCKGNLYVYGGIFEEGNKQHTLSDFYSLDLNKLNEWKTLIPNSLGGHEWIDSGSEGSDSDDDDDDDLDTDDDDEDDDDETSSGMDTD